MQHVGGYAQFLQALDVSILSSWWKPIKRTNNLALFYTIYTLNLIGLQLLLVLK